MSVHQTLLCCFLLSLQVGNSTTDDGVVQFYSKPGEILSVRNAFSRLYGSQKIFCRENCEGENLLISTSQKTAQRGRYGTEYKEDGFQDYNQGSPVLSVSILNLTPSDSGLYRCGLGNSSSTTEYRQFRVLVADAVLKETKVHFSKTAGSSLTVACSFNVSGKTKSFCRGECDGNKILLQTDGDTAQSGRYYIENKAKASGGHLIVTIKHLTESDSGRYRCYLDKSSREFTVTVTSSETSSQKNPGTPGGTCGGTSNHDVPLIVGLTLGVTVVLLAAALLVSCRRRSLEGPRSRRNPDGANMEEVVYENSSSQDPTYQSLSPATRDQNQIYSALTH
ncbi:CD226 antigen-like isoform X1 [Kryptolebias marmoratus]|uniref:CD226 antigen-like isoform X1 n=1 Tax=Kryptolebias marmoratus TaxID=37003 RepID=UPI0007F8EADF|nr:CD226 antigen-like isoform X1 [Kryptolebias marmoratus]